MSILSGIHFPDSPVPVKSRKRVVPSPLDPLSHEWEMVPFPTSGLMLPLARCAGEGDWGVRVESKWKFMNRSS